MKKIGIMGGSFDPCHIGHLSLAMDAKRQYSLDEVIFIPAKLQPFKMDLETTPSYMRMEMLNLFLESFEGFKTCDIELLREGPSYTYLTMRELKAHYNNEDTELYFILGTDAFLRIKNWEKASEFLSENNFLVGSRPGYREDELYDFIKELSNEFKNKICKVDNKKINISSTLIRKYVEDNKGISNYVGEKQEKYIIENKLYTKEFKGKRLYFNEDVKIYSDNKKIDCLMEFLNKNLSKKRVRHILGVCKLAENLGINYGINRDSILLSVLCHDIAKELKSYELNDLISIYQLDEKYKNRPNLSHSKIAAKLAEDFLAIEDEDILNAISFHTTGRENMSLLEKIIFISDFAEEGRHFDGVEKIRDLIFKDLDKACLDALRHTIKYLKSKNEDIDEDSIKALHWFQRKVD